MKSLYCEYKLSEDMQRFKMYMLSSENHKRNVIIKLTNQKYEK